MKYAIIADVPQPFYQWILVNDDFVLTALTATPGTIINLIEYNVDSQYVVKVGRRLAEVPDEAQIGDTGY